MIGVHGAGGSESFLMDDRLSAVTKDFLQYSTGVLHNYPLEAWAEDTGCRLYLAAKLMNWMNYIDLPFTMKAAGLSVFVYLGVISPLELTHECSSCFKTENVSRDAIKISCCFII